jgi:hypothetical protein
MLGTRLRGVGAKERYGSSAKEIAARRVMKRHTEKGHSAGE